MLKIRYCHWKSNEHLDEALAGKTDLDVLIHLDDKSEFEKALTGFQFKKILSPTDKQFPGLEDYLGFDHISGAFVHLHVHYRLVMGQKYIKNHHLPIEELFFNNLIVKNNLFIPCPELELILLVIRAHMKVDLLSLIKHAIKDFTSDKYTAFPSDIETELSMLASRIDPYKFKILLDESKLPLREEIFIDVLDRFSNNRLKFYQILFVHLEILKALKGFRRTKSVLVYTKYLNNYLAEMPILRKLRVFKRKTFPEGGKIFSIVGADGSGKSTLVEDLEKWLKWKLYVKKYYYGIPKNIINTVASLLITNLNRLRLRFFASIIEASFWLYVARVRRSISKLSQKDAREGKVIVTDRFPLKHFHDMPEPMDGPRLSKNGTLAGRCFAKRESKIYEGIEYPDRIFVLQVGLEELRKRKTDLSLETHKIKAAAVNSISEQESLVLIDASKPYEDVLLQVKRLIWEIL